MLPCPPPPQYLDPIDLIRRSIAGVCGSWFGKCRIGVLAMWQLAYPISNSDIDRFRQNGFWEIAETWREGWKGYVIGRQYRVHKAQEIKLRWGGRFAAFSRSSKDQFWWQLIGLAFRICNTYHYFRCYLGLNKCFIFFAENMRMLVQQYVDSITDCHSVNTSSFLFPWCTGKFCSIIESATSRASLYQINMSICLKVINSRDPYKFLLVRFQGSQAKRLAIPRYRCTCLTLEDLVCNHNI